MTLYDLILDMFRSSRETFLGVVVVATLCSSPFLETLSLVFLAGAVSLGTPGMIEGQVIFWNFRRNVNNC
jgi:hypothetical protein